VVESNKEQVKVSEEILSDKDLIEESKQEFETTTTQSVDIKGVEETVVSKESEHKVTSEVHKTHTNKKKKRKGNGKQDKETKREYKELKSRVYKYFYVPTGSINNKSDTSKQHKKLNGKKDIQQNGKTKKEIDSTLNVEEQKTLSHNEPIVKDIDTQQKGNQVEKKLKAEIKRVVDELEIYNLSLYSICENIRKVIQAHAAKAFSSEVVQAILYGSAALGLALEFSDIDITLTNIEATSSENYMLNVLLLGQHFEAQDFVEKCKVITTARVPVVKLVLNLIKMGITFSRTEIKLDITISDQIYRPSAYYGVHFSLWVIQKLCTLPNLKPLILLSKRLLAKHELNNLYYGNLPLIL
jgi:DNA polymerase sigma